MMTLYDNPSKSQWKTLCQRPKADSESLSDLVRQIFDEVKRNGDFAVSKYENLFGGSSNSIFKVDAKTVSKSADAIPGDLKQAIRLAYSNISKFHVLAPNPAPIETMPGVKCWSEKRAIDRVGIYIPGGSAPLFSTVLMLGIPAKIVGCKEIVLCSPSDKNGTINPAILFAANLVGIEEIYAVGGIQAIAAISLGTETIASVDKIFGPGNQYVTAAKSYAQQLGIAIDMPAGPSEVLVISDASSDAEFVAADLLSQAEHGQDSQVVLLSNDKQIIASVNEAINRQLEELPRKEIASRALKNSRAIYFETLDECLDFSNEYAPEHLILAIENPETFTRKIRNAGSVFLGKYSCESAGDYASGTNHTLPTNGFAKSYSGISTDSFTKRITFQQLTREGLQDIGPSIVTMANAESLQAHANAVSIRLNKISNV